MLRAALLLTSSFLILVSPLSAKPNLLIITTDDMSCDSVGAYGCKLKDVTPNMDIPATVPGGTSIKDALQHLQTKSVPAQ